MNDREFFLEVERAEGLGDGKVTLVSSQVQTILNAIRTPLESASDAAIERAKAIYSPPARVPILAQMVQRFSVAPARGAVGKQVQFQAEDVTIRLQIVENGNTVNVMGAISEPNLRVVLGQNEYFCDESGHFEFSAPSGQLSGLKVVDSSREITFGDLI